MSVRKDRLSLMNVFSVITLCIFFLAGSTPAFAVSIEPGAAFAPGQFSKAEPTNGFVSYTPDLTLTWGTSSGATDYEVCVDTNDNNTCDKTWDPQGLATTVDILGLLANTTYYWQARAKTSPGTDYTYANNGVWWSFRTSTPTAFSKESPTTGASVGTMSVTLTWKASSHLTRYEYCIDTTNDAACGTTWKDAGQIPSAVASVPAIGTYFWQVRAVNDVGITEADSGNWWRISAQPPQPFSKQSPADNTVTFLANPPVTWSVSSNATRYEYCVDTSNNNACGTAWQNAGLNLSAALPLSSVNTTYYWQIRAVNDFGTTDAGPGTWWRLTRLPNFPRYIPMVGKAK